MKLEQAIRINDHLLAAYKALDQARMAIAGLAKAERIELGDWLDEVVAALEDELLQPIYDQYPDLEPPKADQEEPAVFSELAWADVQLPSSVTEQQLDEVIFSLLTVRWKKTAAIVVLAEMQFKKDGLPITSEIIAARLKVLSDSDRIEGIGDLRMWRHSEVRLKD